MHAKTRIANELYDVTGMSEDSRTCFTMASDQEERPSLRIGGEKYHVACSPGRVRCKNNHVRERVTIYHNEQIR